MHFGIFSKMFELFLVLELLEEAMTARTKYTHKPVNGLYCPDGYHSNLTAIEHHRCVAFCTISPSCFVLAYNANERYCLLGEKPCTEPVPQNGFLMMIFRRLEEASCVNWQWSDGSSHPSRMVEVFQPRHEAVARRQIDDEIYIGYAVFINKKVNLNVKGNEVKLHDYYLLEISESCSVAWVPFISDKPLPRGAVKGGYLHNYGVVYCMRLWETTDERHLFGYYAPSVKLGFYAWYGSKSATTMDIHVQIDRYAWELAYITVLSHALLMLLTGWIFWWCIFGHFRTSWVKYHCTEIYVHNPSNTINHTIRLSKLYKTSNMAAISNFKARAKSNDQTDMKKEFRD